jgi:hypothetical protein
LLENQPILGKLFIQGFEKDQLLYSLPATVTLGLVGVGLLWWLKSLPYTASAEERLQEALDHQVALPAKVSA